MELQKCCIERSENLFITSDFAENVQVIRKHELSDQFFHRIEILLFGAVTSMVEKLEEGSDELVPFQSSYMVCSDYR